MMPYSVCEQRKILSVCASAQSDQIILCSHKNLRSRWQYGQVSGQAYLSLVTLHLSQGLFLTKGQVGSVHMPLWHYNFTSHAFLRGMLFHAMCSDDRCAVAVQERRIAQQENLPQDLREKPRLRSGYASVQTVQSVRFQLCRFLSVNRLVQRRGKTLIRLLGCAD